MKIALVGKGGSGKSSVSWLITEAFLAAGKKVLAIDADQNADLAHNLGISDVSELPWFNNAESDIYEYFKLHKDEKAMQVIGKNVSPFFLDPKDTLTQKYSREIKNNLHLIVTGNHHPDSLWSGRCTHAYMKATKFYLPYLQVPDEWVVVVDSPAGTDMITYGLHLGVDVMVSVVEDTKNSLAVAEQQRKIAHEFGIPHFYVFNKVNKEKAIAHGGQQYVEALAHFAQDLAVLDYDFSKLSEENKKQSQDFIRRISKSVKKENTLPRFLRWIEMNKSMNA